MTTDMVGQSMQMEEGMQDTAGHNTGMEAGMQDMAGMAFPRMAQEVNSMTQVMKRTLLRKTLEVKFLVEIRFLVEVISMTQVTRRTLPMIPERSRRMMAEKILPMTM